MRSKDECLILFLVLFYNWDLSNPETKFHKNITYILTLIDILVSLIYFNFNVNLTALNWPQVDGSLQTILGYGRVTGIASGRVEPSLEVRVVPLPLALP